MKLTGQGVFYIVAAGVLFFAARKVFAAVNAVGGTVADTGAQFIEGLQFWAGTKDAGPGIELAAGHEKSIEEYIALGYMQRGADGVARITPAGEQYIEEQRRMANLQNTGFIFYENQGV